MCFCTGALARCAGGVAPAGGRVLALRTQSVSGHEVSSYTISRSRPRDSRPNMSLLKSILSPSSGGSFRDGSNRVPSLNDLSMGAGMDVDDGARAKATFQAPNASPRRGKLAGFAFVSSALHMAPLPCSAPGRRERAEDLQRVLPVRCAPNERKTAQNARRDARASDAEAHQTLRPRHRSSFWRSARRPRSAERHQVFWLEQRLGLRLQPWRAPFFGP